MKSLLYGFSNGFGRAIGRLFALLLFAFIVYIILKGVDFNWRDIIKNLYYL